jgi:hypothetical protein
VCGSVRRRGPMPGGSLTVVDGAGRKILGAVDDQPLVGRSWVRLTISLSGFSLSSTSTRRQHPM